MKRAGILAGALLLGLWVDALSQTLSLSVSSGLFFAREKTYRDIYGASLPLDAEVRLGLVGPLGLAAGFSYIRDGGQAINVNQGPDRYPVRFRRVSFPLSVYLQWPLNKVSLHAGAGMSVHYYEETWETLSLSHKGNRTKPLAYAGIEYRVLPRVAARLTLRYETVNAGKNPFLANDINLGGFTLLAGLSLRLF